MFDILATANALKEAELEEAQAVAIVDALRHALTENVTTKANLSELRAELKTEGAIEKIDTLRLRPSRPTPEW